MFRFDPAAFAAYQGGELDLVLFGNGGDDSFAGTTGNDQFNGGTGVDTVDYSATTLGVVVNLTTGTATRQPSGRMPTGRRS